MTLKLNLGAGETVIDGFLALDRKWGHEVYPLGYEDESVDEIRASHILEHFGQNEVFGVVQNWVDKLKVGGAIKIAVPNFTYIAQGYLNRQPGESFNTAGYLMGGQTDQNDFHKAIFDEDSLRAIMQAAGLEEIERWTDDIQDCAALPVSLNLKGKKVNMRRVRVDCTKVFAILSVPRLTFTDNMRALMRTFIPPGVQINIGTGVFWEQVLTRLIEDAIKRGAETIVTVDYDTWFRREHWLAMLKLMCQYPEADAIVPVQIMRERNHPLVGVRGEQGQVIEEIPPDQMEEDLTRIVTGHFGLSFFRADAFAKMSKPWFHSKPDKDGGWGAGRQDADITFWNNWNASGLRAFMANKVNIGHMQLMCTYPGTKDNDYQPVHCYMGDVDDEKYPDHAVPKEI